MTRCNEYCNGNRVAGGEIAHFAERGKACSDAFMNIAVASMRMDWRGLRRCRIFMISQQCPLYPAKADINPLRLERLLSANSGH